MTYSQAARTSLRNVCRTHETSIVRQLGRVALFEETKHGALLALRLREKHPEDVQLERTTSFNEFRDVPESIRKAARAYENRENENTAYAKFAKGTPHPASDDLKHQEL